MTIMAPRFCVIIVGGGPIGLAAALMFTKAGIDFVVLERGSEACPDRGASLAMWPPTIRIFDQLGLYDALCANSCPVNSTTLVTHDGKQYDRQGYPTASHHGHSGRICHRADVLRVLYNSLPLESKQRVHLNKTVTSMSVTEDSAMVTCHDGTIFHGSMILGADGVHSTVRTLARVRATEESSEEPPFPESPYVSTFRLVFGSMSTPKGHAPGDMYESHGKDTSTQLMNGGDKSWFFLYRRLPAPTRKRAAYTEEDSRQFVKEMEHIYMAPNLTVGDIYSSKTSAANMVNLEEGILDRRSWKRVLLVGDSCHKMTPNVGFGFHNGLWDLVVLTNRLREECLADPQGPVSTPALTKIFSVCQEDRRSHTSTLFKMSGDVTRSSTWQTWPAYFLDRYLMPWTYSMKWMSTLIIAPLLKVCPVLDWLPEPNFKSGSVPWVHVPKATA